jgi:ubiquinone/menaquinone biosynthesis C-methylase UbiE
MPLSGCVGTVFKEYILHIELIIKEKMAPLYRLHYALWVYWWPLWRSIYSGRSIRRKWRKYGVVKEGQTFLDYGCGTGCFTIPAARIIGKRGQLHALDCFPRQLQIVERRSREKGLTNVNTILADTQVNLPDESVDVVWMCDVLHEVEEKRLALEDIHRVLREDGCLAIYDGMKEAVLGYTHGLFSLTDRDGKFMKFGKVSR